MSKNPTRPAPRPVSTRSALARLACLGLVIATVGATAGATGCATESQVRAHREGHEIALDRLQRQSEDHRDRLSQSSRLLVDLSDRLDAVQETAEETVLLSQEARRQAARVAGQPLITETLFADDSIRFASGSAELTANARLLLDLFAAELQARGGDFFVEIHGHADRTGDETRNRHLARERAERVRRYLHDRHELPMPRMHLISHGSEDPLEPSDGLGTLARSRRVTLVVRH